MKIDRDVLIVGGVALLALGGLAWLSRSLGTVFSDVGERVQIAMQPRVELSDDSENRAAWLEDIYGPEWKTSKFAQVEADFQKARERYGVEWPTEHQIRAIVLERAQTPKTAADGFQYYGAGIGTLDDHALAKYGFYQDMTGL